MPLRGNGRLFMGVDVLKAAAEPPHLARKLPAELPLLLLAAKPHRHSSQAPPHRCRPAPRATTLSHPGSPPPPANADSKAKSPPALQSKPVSLHPTSSAARARMLS